MQLKIKKNKKETSIVSRYTVPVPEHMKDSLDKLKAQKNIDVNGMARDYFQLLIEQISDEKTEKSA